MIFYFSATGNSLYVAKQLAKYDERLVFIPDAIDNQIYEYDLKEGDNVGIISPTYNWTIPSVVEEFLKKLKLNYKQKPYTYYVGTFGTTTGAASSMANKYLKENGYLFDAMFDVKMPDTWTPMYDLSNKEHVQEINKKADEQILKLKENIANKVTGKHMHITMPYVAGVIGKQIYDNKTRCTKNLSLEDTCIGCGLCAKKCPVHAIEMVDKHPVWIKEKCTMCLGCLHRCPKFAIQYGNNTKAHGQYHHPHDRI